MVQLVDEAFKKKSWHGTNLRGSIRGLTAHEAGWRPPGSRHSIADIAVHCAYWKYAVRRRLRSDPRGSFPLKGSNWFKLAEPVGEPQWKDYVALLESEHAALRDAIADVAQNDMDAAPAGRKTSNRMLVHGIVLHDVYHAGQIQVLKAMWRRAHAR
jgi:uncharacterized damage-inducible protein DinB